MSSTELPLSDATPEIKSLSDSQEVANATPLENAGREFKPGSAFYLAFGSLCIITLAAALDATSLSIALPIITDKLHGTAIEAFWSGTSFLVTSAVFQPVIAGLSHGFGRKLVWQPYLELCWPIYSYSSVGSDFVALLRCGFDTGCRG